MLLALDSSSLTLSVALGEPGDPLPLASERHGPPAKMSDLLPDVLLALLGRHGKSLTEVQAFVVGLGPGSFTGLRIGLATVKGLAYALRIPVSGASSLAALALDGPEGAPLGAIAVARRGEIYLGRYRRSGSGVVALAPEEACSHAELARWVDAEPEARLVGPAVHEVRPELLAAGIPPARLLDAPDVPSAWAVARLAPVPAAFDFQALAALEPHYVRPSEAERNPKFPPLPGPAPRARLRDEETP